MIRRSGSETLEAGIDVAPWAVLPAPAGPGCETMPVCADVADVEPLEFVAVTATRSVLSTSAAWTVYVWAFVSAIGGQLLPAVSQRCHWYVYVGFVSLFQVPVPAVSVWPTCGVPLIVGAAEFTGA